MIGPRGPRELGVTPKPGLAQSPSIRCDCLSSEPQRAQSHFRELGSPHHPPTPSWGSPAFDHVLQNPAQYFSFLQDKEELMVSRRAIFLQAPFLLPDTAHCAWFSFSWDAQGVKKQQCLTTFSFSWSLGSKIKRKIWLHSLSYLTDLLYMLLRSTTYYTVFTRNSYCNRKLKYCSMKAEITHITNIPCNEYHSTTSIYNFCNIWFRDFWWGRKEKNYNSSSTCKK